MQPSAFVIGRSTFGVRRFLSGVLRVHGPEVGKDAALIGAGLNMQWNNRFATYVYYDGVLGRSNYDNNAVTGGLRVGF